MSDPATPSAPEGESLAELIEDTKRGLTAIPDVTVTDDERRFIAWARYYHGGVTGLVVKYDQRGEQLAAWSGLVAAARAVVAKVDGLRLGDRDHRGEYFGYGVADVLDNLAARVRELDR